MDKKSSFMQVKKYFERAFQWEKDAAIKTYQLTGTHDVNEMVGYVGFIDSNGKYYKVREAYLNGEEIPSDALTHEKWASKYLYYILKRRGSYSSYVSILVNNFNFGMVVEDDDKLQFFGGRGEMTPKQMESFDLLQELTTKRKKGR